MIKTFNSLVLLIAAISISACSSSHKINKDPGQYCYTTENISVDNGVNVNTNTNVQCSDKPRVEHVVKDIGVASNCRISRPINVQGNDPKYGETLLCRFTDPLGKTVWREVNEVFSYPSFN